MPDRTTERRLLKARFEATRPSDSVAQVWLQSISPYLPVKPEPTIVDLGCGFGHFAILFAKQLNARVVAIEPDETVRREAAKRNSYSSVIYMAGNGERVPVQNDEVDAVFLSHVVGCLTDLVATLTELRRLLRPGGIILVRDLFRGGTEGIPMYEFFPDSRRAVEATLIPSNELVQAVLDQKFTPIAHDLIRQEISSSFHGYTDHVRALAEAGLVGVDDQERERGRAAMERRCSMEHHPTPVFEREELLVIKKN